jgi:hypothetical protein
MWAATNNHMDEVISLMNHPGIDVNVQSRYNNTALHWAAYNNHPAIVSQLLSDDNINANLKNRDNKTPLKWAIDNRNIGTAPRVCENPPRLWSPGILIGQCILVPRVQYEYDGLPVVFIHHALVHFYFGAGGGGGVWLLVHVGVLFVWRVGPRVAPEGGVWTSLSVYPFVIG